jgi:hypothetical protein
VKNREALQLHIELAPHHEKMIGEIIQGVGIQCENPGNAAIGASLRCGAAVAAARLAGAITCEFVHPDGRRRSVPIENMFRDQLLDPGSLFNP